jgi:hypothetical protein
VTNDAVVTLAGFALVLALASGARAKWKTASDQPRTVNPKAGETWKLTGTSTTAIPDSALAQYPALVSAEGLGDVLSASLSPDHKSFSATIRYGKDVELPVGVSRSLTPEITLTLTDAVRV